MKLCTILKKHSAVGVAGNRSTAKTCLVLNKLIELRKDYPKLNIAVMGVNNELEPVMNKYNITILRSRMDILDLQLTDSVLFVDESAIFFDSRSKSKQLTKLQRFFDRIEHLNNKIILGTARENYWNKFMCSRITAFLVKEIEYDSLVNGSWLKERVKAIDSLSEYRLAADKNEYYIVTAGDGQLTTKHTFGYNAELDTKKHNKDLFEKAKEKESKNKTKKKL